MSVSCLLAVSALLAGLASAADTDAVKQAAERVRQLSEKAPGSLGAEFRTMAAKSLQPRYPDLAKQLSPPAPAPATPRPTAPAGGTRPAPPPELAAIQKRIGQMRGLPTDADRAKLALEITADIRALPAGIAKLGPASSLGNLATEGDLGKDALDAVAATLALALRETPVSAAGYIQLARLVRYEHVTPPPADPALDAAMAVLALRDEMLQDAGFTLTGLDGKSYSLDALRGRVVLLNFWATWCPPCRKEMPDLEKLYQQFQKKGLVVLAVSDEKRETVEKFLAERHYSFPILLDPDRKVNDTFNVEGIPKSFLFDRQGKLAAQAIDMRTERQFLEMFRAAGLE